MSENSFSHSQGTGQVSKRRRTKGPHRLPGGQQKLRQQPRYAPLRRQVIESPGESTPLGPVAVNESLSTREGTREVRNGRVLQLRTLPTSALGGAGAHAWLSAGPPPVVGNDGGSEFPPPFRSWQSPKCKESGNASAKPTTSRIRSWIQYSLHIRQREASPVRREHLEIERIEARRRLGLALPTRS